LFTALAYVVILPTIYPALVAIPLVSLAAALPFAEARLLKVLGVATWVTIVAMGVAGLGLQPGSLFGFAALLTLTGVACVGLLAVLLLVQYRQRSLHQMRQVKRANEALLHANAELESFSYSVSHDLRAPLRSMDGFAQALIEDYGGQLDDTARDYVQRVRDASQRMAGLIEGILELSRIVRQDMHREPVDLSAMAQEVLDSLAAQEPQRQVDIHVAGGLVAECDRRLLHVVLDNLLGNAWKYTSKHPQARIEFGRREAAEGAAACYFVRDDGAGFDMKYSGNLFGAFQRMHGVSEFAGHGVGLATVQRIIRRHGGRIWAEAQMEKGATFFFTLWEPASRPPSTFTSIR
jgi:light-regulated signal transduction histidine kinase (bacteriophytochrome)